MVTWSFSLPHAGKKLRCPDSLAKTDEWQVVGSLCLGSSLFSFPQTTQPQYTELLQPRLEASTFRASSAVGSKVLTSVL